MDKKYGFKISKAAFNLDEVILISDALAFGDKLNKFLDDDLVKAEKCIEIKPGTNNVEGRLIDKKMASFIEYINENINEINRLISDSEVTIDDVIENDKYNQNIRILYKMISIYIDYKQLKERDILVAMKEMNMAMEDIKTFTFYALAKYIISHLEGLELEKDRIEMFSMLLKPYIDLCTVRFQNECIERTSESLVKEERELKKEISQKDKAVIKYKKKEQDLFAKKNKEIEELKNRNTETIKNLKDEHEIEMKLKDSEITDLEFKISNLENKNQGNTVSESVHKKLKDENLKLKHTNTELKTEYRTLNNKSIYDLLEEHLKKKGEDLKISQLLFMYSGGNSNVSAKDNHLLNLKNEDEVIGICKINNGVHYIEIPNEREYEIKNIEKGVYFANNSFVRVDKHLNFLWHYPYKCVETSNDNKIVKYVELLKDDKHYYYCNANRKRVQVNEFKFTMPEHTIAGVNKENQVIASYEHIPFIVDNYKKSIKAQNDNAYLVLNKLDNGLVVRDILNDKELFISMEDVLVDIGTIIFVNDNIIIESCDDSTFYTLSNEYKNIETCNVTIENDKTYITKLNGEKVLINEVDYTFALNKGDLITVDEFNRVISNLTYQINIANSKNIFVEDEQFTVDDINIDFERGRALIVGNKSLSDAYKRIFNKNGYDVEIVGGFEPYKKISMQAKDYDKVILVTDHCSHTNYFLLKDEFKDKVVYTHKGGANKVFEALSTVL
ncbi:MAG: hypothetical protein JJE03_06895 [Peptostreptococcaceae bacterium]|nr:hypothetical protein [Peptostreptococcaceae bacterium]